MTSLITHHDYLHIHKILGVGCLIHYGYRFWLKYKYGQMFNSDNYYLPAVHLGLSLSSFIFKVPTIRYQNSTIIWKELQLHNIIFTSRSVFMIYHSMLFNYINKDSYYYNHYYYLSRLALILGHHYVADLMTNKYQNNNLTTTRDIIYNTKDSFINKIIIKANKYFYSISQIIATTTLLLSKNYETGYLIMFPIQLSAFLMTLVRKRIINNNQWHYIYTLSLLLPYFINSKGIYNNKNSINLFALFHILMKFGFNTNKYLNFSIITLTYIYKDY
jgi:hypothetical protein